MERSSTKFDDFSFLKLKGYTFGTKISSNRVSKVKFGNNELACKIIKKKNCEENQRMLKILKGISHPHIIPLHSIVQEGSFTCMFTQWSSGGDLFTFIKTLRPIRESKANLWLYQMVSAVEYLHSNKFAYGGLSCKNFLICKEGLKLCGSKRLNLWDDESKTDFKPCPSTPKYYLPPEVHAGKPVNAKKCDIYALGTILFMMLYAKIPFATSCTSQLFEDQTQRRYVVKASSAIDCQVMLHVLLEPEPKVRFSIEKIKNLKWLQKFVDVQGDS